MLHCAEKPPDELFAHLSLDKMSSGLNAFEISDIQEEKNDAGPNLIIGM
jgi:hypothetical protein